MYRYAGIGSRDVMSFMELKLYKIGKMLAEKDFILRSGGAHGCDSAFERGCDSKNGRKEIFLPWKGFKNHPSELYHISKAAIDTVFKYHPKPSNLTDATIRLHARNAHIMLGADLKKPVKFVVCWTKRRGGTMQAIRIAKDYNIPVFNLYEYSDEVLDESFDNFIDRLCNNPLYMIVPNKFYVVD